MTPWCLTTTTTPATTNDTKPSRSENDDHYYHQQEQQQQQQQYQHYHHQDLQTHCNPKKIVEGRSMKFPEMETAAVVSVAATAATAATAAKGYQQYHHCQRHPYQHQQLPPSPNNSSNSSNDGDDEGCCVLSTHSHSQETDRPASHDRLTSNSGSGICGGGGDSGSGSGSNSIGCPKSRVTSSLREDVQSPTIKGSTDDNNWVKLTPFSSSSSSSPLPFRCPNIGLLVRLAMTYFLVTSCCLQPISARPLSHATVMYNKLLSDTVRYLGQYGYVRGPSREAQDLISGETLTAAIKALQKAGNIPQTGIPDSRTEELLIRPRCGVSDESIGDAAKEEWRSSTDKYRGDGTSSSSSRGSNTRRYGRSADDRHRRAATSASRKKRYTLATSKWPHTNLTFRFINYTPDIPEVETRRIISDALRVWSDATPLSFSEVRESNADIMIQFASNYHSDGYPFDGRGMVLAHAFFPGYGKGGDTHFDDDEDWGSGSSDGVDLFMVAAHEFGHALGLAHSGDPEALMYPWYMGFEGKFKLPQDDYLGITSLYGSKEKNRVIPSKPDKGRGSSGGGKTGVSLIPKPDLSNRNRNYDLTTPPVRVEGSTPPDPCHSHIDALTVFRTELFLFIGKWFWRLKGKRVVSAPTEIHSFWYGFPPTLDHIDAAFERKDNKIIFFSGDRYWVFNANHLKKGFPTEGRPISEFNIPSDVKKIDAAYVWGYNNRTYLVSGDMYWKMNEDNNFVEYDYPRDMGTWKNVPVPLDAAFKDRNGKTYFFQGLHYYEFYDLRMRVKDGYPQRFANYMIKCPKHEKKNQEQKDGRGYGTLPLLESEDGHKGTKEKSQVKDKDSGMSLSKVPSIPVIMTSVTFCIFASNLLGKELLRN